jgi:hypothetical protein
MPNNEPSLSELEGLTARKARDEVQLILGQIHGVVWLAINDADLWPEKKVTIATSDAELNVDDVRSAGAEIHEHFGTVHAALNTGRYDGELIRVGLAGAQGEAKKKGLRNAIARFFSPGADDVKKNVARLRGSLRWSQTLVGSIAAALKGEIERVPGAASAGEAIKEFLEVLMNATEPAESQEPPPGGPKRA